MHKARLYALPRYFSTSCDGNIVRVPCGIAVGMIQQRLTDLRLHRFLTVYSMSHHQLPSPDVEMRLEAPRHHCWQPSRWATGEWAEL